MYKLVILDLDGTLLNSDGLISEYTCDTIKSMYKKVKFVLASARGFFTIKNYVQRLDLLDENNYTIAFNGSLVMDNLEHTIINEEIGINEKNIIKDYIDNYKDVEWYLYTYNEKININNIDSIEKFLNNNRIYKVVGITSEDGITMMRNNLPNLISDSFQITSSEPVLIEFVKKGMKKVEAIKVLLDKLDISPNEVIAIGDGENDIDMIKFAGCGVAMKNANDEVKKVADVITNNTNNEDGVVQILKKLIK